MGWRSQEGYDRLERERIRALIASLPAGARMRFRALQLLRVGAVLAFAALLVAYALVRL